MSRPALAVLSVLTVALALTTAACDNSSLVGDGATGNPAAGGNTANAPNAVATASGASGTVPFNVMFSGASSTHPKGLTMTYSWSFSDGTSASGVMVQKQFTQVGSYRALLTVRDPEGASDTASVSVQALAAAIACPALGTPTAGTFYATTCDNQATLFAPAAFYIGASGISGTERTVQIYLLDVASRVQFKVFGTFAPGTTIAPGSYPIVAPTATRNYADFTSSGTLGSRLPVAPTGTLTIETVSTDAITGRITGSATDASGLTRQVVVRFAASRSSGTLG